MTNFSPEMIEKAKAAKSAEELLAIAKENNIEMTEEEAKTYFDRLNSKSGELCDDELDNVAGGTTVRNAFNLQLLPDDATSTNFTRADAFIAREMYCGNCKKNTVFYIPKNGTAYCSVCKHLLAEAVEAPFITE